MSEGWVYVNFVDFEKAFDSVHRESLCNAMRTFEIPEKMVRVIVLSAQLSMGMLHLTGL